MKRLLPVLSLAVACASSNGPPDDKPPINQPTTVYASPLGNDTAAGTREAPFKSIAHALTVTTAQEIALAPGEYVEGELTVGRRVAILGPEEGGATITGHVRISANEVVLSRVDVLRGIELAHASGVVIDHLSVKAGEYDDAVAISSSSAALTDVSMTCGAQTCVQATTSTITLRSARMTGDGNALRGLRAETSSVTVHGVEIVGTSSNQVLASERTKMTITDATLTGALGTALNAVKDSSLIAERVRVENAARLGILIASSRAIVRDSNVGASSGTAVGITGGDVDLIGMTLGQSGSGAITVAQQFDRTAMVRISGGTISHGTKSALLLNAGDVTITGARFVGDAKSANADGDAVIADGPSALLRIMSATFETPAGFAVSLTNNASATITATITGPKEGGVFVQDVAGVPVTIDGSRIERCGMASGVVVFNSIEVSVIKTRVHSCPEAGVLAGVGSTVSVRRSTFTGNAQYGLGAFGASSIDVGDSVISGSPWATFATCGDGSSIEDAGGNRFTGPVTTCP